MVDLANPKRNWNKTPGYTEIETSWFRTLLDPPEDAEGGANDVCRHALTSRLILNLRSAAQKVRGRMEAAASRHSTLYLLFLSIQCAGKRSWLAA
jgi:hypothetical protein